MILGVPKESYPGERRVAIVPAVIPALRKAGLEVLVEAGAGMEAGYPDRDYTEKGAKLAADRTDERVASLSDPFHPALIRILKRLPRLAARRTVPLSQKALLVTRSVPGVTTVLVGMRDTAYVADALAVMGSQPVENAVEILRACRGVDLP